MTSGIDLRTIGADLRLAHRFRESVQTKGRRYLLDGRLTIHHVSDTTVEATARGQGHIYRMSSDRAQLERLRDKLRLVIDDVPEAAPELRQIEDDLKVLDLEESLKPLPPTKESA